MVWCALAGAWVAPAAAQQPSPVPPARTQADPELTAFARAFVAVGLVRDELNAQLALPRNKTVEHQAEIRAQMKEKVEQVIRAAGLTPEAYHRIEYQVTVDPARRAAFDQLLAELARSG